MPSGLKKEKKNIQQIKNKETKKSKEPQKTKETKPQNKNIAAIKNIEKDMKMLNKKIHAIDDKISCHDYSDYVAINELNKEKSLLQKEQMILEDKWLSLNE